MKELLEYLAAPTGLITITGLAIYLAYTVVKQRKTNGNGKIAALHYENGQLVLTSSVIKYIDDRARHKASQLVQIERVHRESLQREVRYGLEEIRKDIETLSRELSKHVDDDAQVQDDISNKLTTLLSFHRREDRE